MNTAPLSEEARDKLKKLFQKKPISQWAEKWGIDRATLSEAFSGYAKRAATRYMIEAKLREEAL